MCKIIIVLLRFVSDYGTNADGFQMEYNTLELFTECGGTYLNASGILTSPSQQDRYHKMVDCVYLISQSNGTYVNISVMSMDINCNSSVSGYIEMRDGNSEDSPLMGKWCGNDSDIPAFMQTTQSYLRIR